MIVSCGLIRVIEAIIEKKDKYIAGHQARVAELVSAICGELGLDAATAENVRLAALIHDIGKIFIPAEILTRPGRLTPTEFDFIKLHPATGYHLLKSVEFPLPIADFIHQHHEKLDGSGYPLGLKGEEIRLESKIVAVAEVVEAMSSHRPHRPAHSLEEALSEIEAKRGIWFEPDVVDACLGLFRDKDFRFHRSV
jgi:putative nucleotidyltransferase with HDIG domain